MSVDVITSAGLLNDMCVDMLDAVGQGVDDNMLGMIAKSPEAFNHTLAAAAQTVAADAARPVASVILSVVIMLRMAQIGLKADGDQRTALRMVAMAMVQSAIIIVFAQHAADILSALSSIGDWMMGRIRHAVPTGSAGRALGLGTRLKDEIGRAGTIDQAGMLVVLLPAWLVSRLATVVVTVVVYLRFIQIYLLTALAPIPFALLGEEHTRQWGIDYIRQFSAVVVQSVVLYLSLVFYRVLAVQSVDPNSYHAGDSLGSWIVSNYGGLLLASVLLITVVVTSNAAARKVLGA
ncbi:hypothetical protein Uis1B_2059 [Bifidobacterium margollesii]|uniref:TrbL/VirB6 plasmid conjugal transfer protein n=1 Tax=Bifidobacterium margollesii TaxID=2020964 RepID=A0A2N5J7B6_9BIFI|nr:type IV secretion system protein [Bifidobacterium margollesii]PLS30108.1 hypothetical protein Uis1B_2059 [Bifidobacterium margollesii]